MTPFLRFSIHQASAWKWFPQLCPLQGFSSHPGSADSGCREKRSPDFFQPEERVTGNLFSSHHHCIIKKQDHPFGWSCFYGAGDEARLHFSLQSKEKLLCCRRPAGGNQLSTGQLTLIFEPSSPHNKNKRPSVRMVFVFMERVTRLELATSTLARWRSTG